MARSHKIGVSTATIVGMNAMIGAGIFSAPETLAGTNGIVALCTYIFVIATVWALALSISRVAYLYPEAGSFYTYAYQWGGQYAGIAAVSLYLIGLFVAMGLLTNLASTYLYGFFPYHQVFPYLHSAYIAYGLLITLTALNIAGAELSELGQTVLIIATVFPIVATTIACLTKADTANLIIPTQLRISDILSATKSVIFGFFGFESAASLYQVVRDPERNVPRALTYSIILVGILYLAFIGTIIMAAPPSVLAEATSLTDILQTIFPHQKILINMIHVAVLSAIIGTLHAMLWSASALLRATVSRVTSQIRISPTVSALLVGGTIAFTYTTIHDLDTYFSLTVISVVTAYTLSLLTLLFKPREWRNGQNIITSAGLLAAGCMITFAVQSLLA